MNASMTRGIAEPDELKAFVYEGLANRINCIASAYSIQPEFRLQWSINSHCPLRFEELFKNLDGVRVQNVKHPEFRYRKSTRRICWFYLLNVRNKDPQTFGWEVKNRYRYLIGRLTHPRDFQLEQESVGVSFRSLLPNRSSESLELFLHKLKRWLIERMPKQVFVASDHQASKNRLIAEIKNLGISTVSVDCPLLDSDLNRSKANVIGMSKELVLFSQCKLGIISNSTRSTTTDSARGFDVPVLKTFRCKKSFRDPNIEELFKCEN